MMEQVKSKGVNFSMSNPDGNIIIIKGCVSNNLSRKKTRHNKIQKSNKRRTVVRNISNRVKKTSSNVDRLSPVKSIDSDQSIYKITLHLFDSDYIDRLQSIIVIDEKNIFEKLSDSINKRARHLMNLLIT